jgi:tetratricopeptide (TPR) repeat protein
VNTRHRIILVAGVSALACGVAWAGWAALRRLPSLDNAIRLAVAGRFDEAEAIVRDYLKADPQSPKAHMLAAQFALNRPVPPAEPGDEIDPAPALAALDHLSRIRTEDRFLAALAALYRGKAEYRLLRYDDAEASWKDALRLDPKVPEAGWHLLELYYLQGRSEDARNLALRLHEVEPDPRDRVQFLLELLRQDAQVPAPESVARAFEPVVRTNPDDLYSSLALGRALVRSGQVDEGLEVLRRLVQAQPDRADLWDAWLSGFDEAGQIEALARALDHVPPSVVGSPLFARHEALVAQEKGDWQTAARAYRRALQATQDDHRLAYRLGNALRKLGEDSEAERHLARHRAATDVRAEVRAIYNEANAIKDLGQTPHPDLYQRIADIRERCGRVEESLAWHRLVLQARPGDARSQSAVERLEAERKLTAASP